MSTRNIRTCSLNMVTKVRIDDVHQEYKNILPEYGDQGNIHFFLQFVILSNLCLRLILFVMSLSSILKYEFISSYILIFQIKKVFGTNFDHKCCDLCYGKSFTLKDKIWIHYVFSLLFSSILFNILYFFFTLREMKLFPISFNIMQMI